MSRCRVGMMQDAFWCFCWHVKRIPGLQHGPRPAEQSSERLYCIVIQSNAMSLYLAGPGRQQLFFWKVLQLTAGLRAVLAGGVRCWTR